MANLEPMKAAISALQPLYLRTHDELLALEDFVHGSADVVLHQRVFSLQIEKGEEHLSSNYIANSLGLVWREIRGRTASDLRTQAAL